ncbi:MAG: GTPase Era [Alphaproteobacteria bacterium]|nr:GTPase Era [Alphaproteobacteria bacterium]
MTKCGFVTLLGASNAGKSTLVNNIVGAKVSIVSPKVQTTRSRVRGIVVKDDCEIVLVDTPGIFKPRRRLDRAMIASAWEEAEYTDIVAVVVDSNRGLDFDTQSILESLKSRKQKAILVLNKIDLITKPKLLALAAQLNELFEFRETFMVSALSSEGIDTLEKWIIENLPEGPFMFPEDQISDLPNKLLASEITREKLYMCLDKELPYVTAVSTDSWKETNNNSVRIEQTIFVEKDNQKQIIIGKNGSMVKKIGMASRKELCELFDCKIDLFIFVKVRKKWEDNPEMYKDWGLDFNA